MLIFLIFIFSASALKVTYTPIHDELLQKQNAEFIVHFENNEVSTTTVKFKTEDVNWALNTRVSAIDLIPGEKMDINLVYQPLIYTPGNYGIKLNLEVGNSDWPLILLPTQIFGYNNVIEATLDSAALIDPRRANFVRIKLTNKRNIELNDLSFKADNGVFEYETVTSLKPNEEKIINFQIESQPSAEQGSYPINIQLKQGEHIFIDEILPFELSSFQDVKERVEPRSGFFKSGFNIIKTNDGNSLIEQEYSKTFGSFAYKFTKFDPQPTRIVKGDNGQTVLWQYTLTPGETKTISYETSYRGPVFILVIIILIILGIYFYKKKYSLEITKKVLTLKTREGKLHSVKTIISLRNTGGTLKDVHVLDKIPKGLAEPSSFLGVQPTLNRLGDSIMAEWKIPIIRSGQELTLSYKLEEKGKSFSMKSVVFPGAVARYVSNRKSIAVRSNGIRL